MKTSPPKAQQSFAKRFDAGAAKTAAAPETTTRPAYLPRPEDKSPGRARTQDLEPAVKGKPARPAAGDDRGGADEKAESAKVGRSDGAAKAESKQGPAEDKKAAAAAAHATGRRGPLAALAEESEPSPPEPEPVPAPDLAAIAIERQAPSPPDLDAAFDGPATLGVKPERRPGAKQEPLAPDIASYLAVFANAAAAARRLHDALVAEALRAAGAARSAAVRRGDRRQAELDADLARLDGGLAEARDELATKTDAALALIDLRAADARALIRQAAKEAKGALRAASNKVHAKIAVAKNLRATTEGSAAAHKASIATLGASAKAAMEKLANSPEAFFPYASDVMKDVVNEAVVMRAPARAGRRAEAIGKELDAQTKAINFSFDTLPAEFEAAFATVNGWIANTEKAGPAAVDAARASALDQLRKMVKGMRGAIEAGRARTEAALVRQHDAVREQLTTTHRNRAKAEESVAAKRTERDLLALKALAVAQGKATRAVADTAAREKGRGEPDFARAVIASSRAHAKRVAETDAVQRPRLAGAPAASIDSTDRQSVTAGERLAASAQSAAAQLRSASDSSAEALFAQSQDASAQFDKLADPVAKSMSAYLPPVGEAFDKVITELEAAVKKTQERVEKYMEGPKENQSAETPSEKPANAKAPPEPPPSMAPNKFLELAETTTKDPRTDGKIRDLETRAKNTVPGKMDEKRAAVWDGIGTFSTNTEKVLSALRSITARQGAAIKFLFRKEHHRDIELYIIYGLPKTFSAPSTNRLNVEAAINYLNGKNIEGALADLQAAVNYSNEERRVEAIQRSLTPAQWSELNRLHGKEIADVRDDLDGVDQKVFDALQFEGYLYDAEKKAGLAEGAVTGLGVAEADALRLREKMGRDLSARGDKGADAAADSVAALAGSAGSDVISGGDPLGLDERALATDRPGFDDYDAVRETNKRQWERAKVAFDQIEEKNGAVAPKDAKPGWSIAAFAGKEREYQVFVADAYSEAGGHYETVRDKISANQTRLIQSIVDFGPDSDEAAAARLMVEMNRDGGKPKPERLDMAMHGGALDARLGEDKSQLPEKEKAARLKQDKDRQTRVLLLYDKLKRGEKPAPRDPRAPPDPKKEAEDEARADIVRKGLEAQLLGQTLGDPSGYLLNKRTLRKPAKDWNEEQIQRRDDAKAAFDYAIAHEDKRADTLKRTFGRMDKSEIDAAVKAWDEDPEHRGRQPLYSQLNLFGKGSWWTEKLSGDERNEVELAAMGVARNDRERALIARMRAEQQIRDAGFLGKLAGKITGDWDRLVESRDKIEDMMGIPRGGFDEMGQIVGEGRFARQGNFDENGKYTPPAGGSAAELERALNLTHITAESYKVMTDSLAAAVTTGLMIAAAIITTALTGGAAASIWIPVLVTAGAGLVGIGLSAAIKGNRYSRAEMERDLVMTFVQAATAGLGAAAGVAIKGGAPALRAVAGRAMVSEKVLERFIQMTGRRGLGKVGAFFAEAGVGGVTNSINSAAAAAMDPTNRARGESGDKALDAGVRSFFGGLFGSALTAPAAKLGGKIAGGYGQRALAAGVSGAGTRTVEIGLERRAHDAPAMSTAEATDEVKAALLQGLAQGGLEEKAGRATDARRAARAAQPTRRAAAAPAPAELAPPRPAPAERAPPVRLEAARPAAETAPSARKPAAPETPAAAPRPARRPPPPEPIVLPLPPEPIVLPLPPDLAEVGAAAKALRPPELPPVVHEATPPPRTNEAEPTPAPVARSRDAGENEPPSSRRVDAEDEPTHPGIGERKPLHDLEGGWIDHPDGTREFIHLPETSVMIDADPTNYRAAVENYGALVRDRPTHEAGLFFNPVTGEHIVIQGNRDMVFVEGAGTSARGPVGEGSAQAWKEILPADKGRWELLAHYHPESANPQANPALRRLPSGVGGDFGLLRSESAAAGNAARSSRIHYLEGGEFKYTDFGFDPGAKRPYWIEFDNPRTGKRDRRDFRSLPEFEGWTGRLLKQPANVAAPDPAPPAGAAPAPRMPKPGAAADDLVLRHGTTKADAATLRESGIDPFRKSGEGEDLSRGFYMTLDDANAQKYARERAAGHRDRGGPEVVEIPVKLSELGAVVDVRKGGAHRKQWDEFLDRSPPAFPAIHPDFPTPWKSAREYLRFGKGIEERGLAFEAFLAEKKLLRADVIRGDLGTRETSGIAAHGHGEQIAIRSKAAADYLNEKLRGAGVPDPDAGDALARPSRAGEAGGPEKLAPRGAAAAFGKETPGLRPGEAKPPEAIPAPAALADALPPSLRRRTPIEIDLSLPSDTVRVVPDYFPDGRIRGVKIVAGPGVRPIDIELHVGVVKAMTKYAGLLGRVRVMLDRVRLWLGSDVVTPFNRGQFEAALELKKLPAIIEERIDRLAAEGADPVAHAEIKADIEHLQKQLVEASERFKQGAAAEAKGYVAAEGRRRKRGAGGEELRKAKPVVESPEPETSKQGEKLNEAETAESVLDGQAKKRSKEIIDELQALEKARQAAEDEFYGDDRVRPALNDVRKDGHKFIEALQSQEIIKRLPADLAREIRKLSLTDANDEGALIDIHRKLTASPEYQAIIASQRPSRSVGHLEKIGAALEAINTRKERVRDLKQEIAMAKAKIAELKAEFEAFGGKRFFNEIPLHPDLGEPAAGWTYKPDELSDSSAAHKDSHINGYQSELRLATGIAAGRFDAEVGTQKVLHYGDKVGAHHADIVSVNPETGDVTLWDSKFRSGKSAPPHSETFTEAGPRTDAIKHAVDVINKDGTRLGLSEEMKKKAIENLLKGNYKAITAHTDGGTFRLEEYEGDKSSEVQE